MVMSDRFRRRWNADDDECKVPFSSECGVWNERSMRHAKTQAA